MAAKKHLGPIIIDLLNAVRERLEALVHRGELAIAEVTQDIAADHNLTLRKLGQSLRVAVTGGPVSPPIDVTLWLAGQQRTMERLDRAIDLVERRAAASGS